MPPKQYIKQKQKTTVTVNIGDRILKHIRRKGGRRKTRVGQSQSQAQVVSLGRVPPIFYQPAEPLQQYRQPINMQAAQSSFNTLGAGPQNRFAINTIRDSIVPSSVNPLKEAEINTSLVPAGVERSDASSGSVDSLLRNLADDISENPYQNNADLFSLARKSMNDIPTEINFASDVVSPLGRPSGGFDGRTPAQKAAISTAQQTRTALQRSKALTPDDILAGNFGSVRGVPNSRPTPYQLRKLNTEQKKEYIRKFKF